MINQPQKSRTLLIKTLGGLSCQYVVVHIVGDRVTLEVSTAVAAVAGLFVYCYEFMSQFVIHKNVFRTALAKLGLFISK